MNSNLMNVQVSFLCKTLPTLIAQEGTHRLSMTFNNWSKCQIKLFKSKLFSVQNATKTYWGCKRYPKNDLVVSPWAKKEPLRARWATEVDHSHQNHRLKKVAPWVCTVGVRVSSIMPSFLAYGKVLLTRLKTFDEVPLICSLPQLLLMLHVLCKQYTQL